MNCSRMRLVRWRNILTGFRPEQASLNRKKRPEIDERMALSDEAQNVLSGMLPSLKSGDEPLRQDNSKNDEFLDFVPKDKIDMDSIRARGFLKYRYNYEPPDNLENQVKEIISEILIDLSDDIRSIDITKNRRLKFQLLNLLGERLCHVIPNSELHRMKTVGDLIDFYRRPFRNLTHYAQMARDSKETLPKNLHIMEHPFRFHPEDIHAYHGGKGGEVVSLRNKRLYRQFKPKKDWFDFEEESFDYTLPSKGMPWDPEIAERMDRYPTKRYNLKTRRFKST
uniref:Large ribosomal subunit protein mL50 n=1 Tax=Setaria digitata TaxID=48799 RepID=A0A915PWS7_9BILA